MKFFRKLFSFFHKKSTRSQNPTLTIVLAINKEYEDVVKARSFLNEQANLLKHLSPKTILIDNITGFKEYNLWCMKDLAQTFDTDFVLVVQMDSRILNADAWDDEFFQYDYIGAPWPLGCNWLVKRLEKQGKDITNKDLFVGNGGFSLRSKKFCEYVRDHAPEKYTENEDSYICNRMRDELISAGFKFAPYEVAKKFSVECAKYTGQFGAHRTIIKDGKKISVKDL